MTTPPCHCGPVLEICQNLIPTVALLGESGSKSSTLPHAADSHSSKHHTMCCRVLLLLTPILWHMPDFPQTYVPWVPQHCICQYPSAPPRPLCPWFPKEMSSFQRSLAFPFPCFSKTSSSFCSLVLQRAEAKAAAIVRQELQEHPKLHMGFHLLPQQHMLQTLAEHWSSAMFLGVKLERAVGAD